MKFSKALRHIDIRDVKKKHLQKESAKIKEEKQKKEFRQYLVSTMETKKYSWREGMTTGNSFSSVLSAEGETAIDQVNPSEITNFSNTDSFLPGNNAALKAATIRSNGSGSGSTGGFNVGGDYLAFQGTSAGDGSRHAILKPIDATNVDTITITAIRGTGSNGGEHPDVVGTEELFIRYKTPDMSTSQYLSFDRSGNAVGSFPDDAAIIAINQGDGTLQDYTITIPEYARQKDVTFALYQKGHSGSEYDHYGVTDIKFQRKTPMTVFVPLDSPAASSFIRSAPSSSTPKKRKKDVDDKLEASDEYTGATFGNDFPGREVRVGGEDPFASAKIGDDVEPSPQGRDEVKKAFSATQLKSALGKSVDAEKGDPIQKVKDIVKSKDTVNNPKMSGIKPVKGDFSNIGDGGRKKMPTDFRSLPAEDLDNLFSNPTSIEAQEAAVDILSKEIKENKPKTANKLSQVGKAGETFLKYLTGTLPDTIDNEFLGDEYVNSMLQNVKVNDYDQFTLNFGDNILGTTQPPVREGKEIVVPFNYDFKNNADELKGREDQLNLLQNTLGRIVADAFGAYSIDGSPKLFGGIPVIGGALDMISGSIFSKFIETGKAFGGSQFTPGQLRLDLEKIAEENPQFLRDLWNNGIISEEEFLLLDKGEPLPDYDPYSKENFRENLPGWFTLRQVTDDGRIFGLNYSGKYGELLPGTTHDGDVRETGTAYGTKGSKRVNGKIIGGTPWRIVYDTSPTDGKLTGDSSQQTPTDRTGYGYDPKGKLDSSGYGMDPNRDTETDSKLAGILGDKKPKNLAGFKSDANAKKKEVLVSTEANNSVKKSPEISQAILKMSPEKQKEAVEQLYPEKAKEILDSADNNVIKLAIEQGISKIIVNQINNTISTPLLDATTSANGFNEYNKFLGDIAKDSNTPGATYENPIDLTNQIAPGDMNELTTTINSGNYQSIVNSIRATNDKNTQKTLKVELEKMIKETINGNFGLNNFMHNNVKVDLNHLLETGKTKLKKQYKFNYGGSAEQIENATLESDPGLFAIKKVADVLGFEYDTLGDPSTVLDTGTPTINVGGTELDPLGILKIIPAIAVTFGPALVAKLGLTNVKLHGDGAYDAPGMYYEVDVPGKYSVDDKGNPTQIKPPSASDQIKQILDGILETGGDLISKANQILFGEDDLDELAPDRSDYPMGRSGAQQYIEDKKLYDAAKELVDSGFGDEQYQSDMDDIEKTDIEKSLEDISILSASEAESKVMEIFEKEGEGIFRKLYDPLYENDPVYKELMDLYDEMDRNATPEGQEFLKQQYEALEFALSGYAMKFVGNVLVQPGEITPGGRADGSDYRNTSDKAALYADVKKAPEGIYFWDLPERERFEKAGIDLEKYDEARALLDTYADDFDYNIVDYIYAQPDYIEAKAEFDRLNSIYISSSEKSHSAWKAYEKFAEPYDGRTFDLRFEKSEYERVVKRGDELYNAYLEADEKAVEDLRARNEIDLSFNKWEDQIRDAGDIVRDAQDNTFEYWNNQEQELKSKMEVILSKINGDYDYYADMEPLEAQLDEVFNRANKQFLQLYYNLDSYTASPEEEPEYDPFKDELKPDLGAEDGDELASSLSGGSYGDYYDVGGGDFRSIDQIMRMYNDPKGSEKYGDKMMKNINQIMLDLDLVKKSGGDLGSVASVGGVDATDAATAAASTREKKKKKGRTSMVAHFAPKGKNLSEEMFLKKSKLEKPNQFFNPDDIKPEFPENPPPKLDPNTGKHPEYGKKSKRYKKLDPHSANSMPVTGDPETDAIVDKQRTKPKPKDYSNTLSKIKRMARNK